ncbi:MAG: TetR/AcrR family transcriptional regulator [Streptosporangiaceae bacterium]
MTERACDDGAAGPGRASGAGGAGGLRERKKRATRQALGSAAMRLAVERGLENVLVEDIAAAADVSPRTFSNYYASKYEAICSLALDRAARIGEALRNRPPGESLWASVHGAVLEVYGIASTAPDPRVMAGIRLVTSSPELRGEYLKTLSIMQYDLARAITKRAGGDPAADTIVARALAGAVTAVIQAATERWLFSDPPVPLAPVVEDALGELAASLHGILRNVLPPGPAGPAPPGPAVSAFPDPVSPDPASPDAR